MKIKFLTLFMLLVCCANSALAYVGYDGRVHVNGYYKQNGTYVQPYTRSLPNSNRWY